MSDFMITNLQTARFIVTLAVSAPFTGYNKIKMKNTVKLDALQRDYFHRLLSDRSVDDKMPFFTQAKRIFDLVNKKSRKRSKR